MITKFAITVFDSKNIEYAVVRETDGEDGKRLNDADKVTDFLSDFTDIHESYLILTGYSPFVGYAVVIYDNGFCAKEIIITWEHFQ
ncbi:hypothetical protein TaPaz_86 [Acinetobacter phage TaPaz]|nr:hypothetical protein TaPaz_86 [Acinetobacter phage TaPaz]